MAENNFNGVVDSLMKGMDGFLSTKTVVGEPTSIGDTIIVPLVDVSFGVCAGSGANTKGNGGVGALNGKMSPTAVLVIHDGHTKLVNIKNQDSVTKLIDLIPDVFDRIKEFIKKDEIDGDKAVEAAFPEEPTELIIEE